MPLLVLLLILALFVLAGVRPHVRPALNHLGELFGGMSEDLGTACEDGAHFVGHRIPASAFSSATPFQVFCALAAGIIIASDLLLAMGGMDVLFQSNDSALTVRLSLLLGVGWSVATAVLLGVLFEAGLDPVPPPWDRLSPRMRAAVRFVCFLSAAVAIASGLAFAAWRAQLLNGVENYQLVVAFLAGITAAMLIATGPAVFAGLRAVTTIVGLVMGALAGLLFLFGVLFHILARALRRVPPAGEALVNLPAMGVATPTWNWLARSRVGRWCGLRPLLPTASAGTTVPAGATSPLAEILEDDMASTTTTRLLAVDRQGALVAAEILDADAAADPSGRHVVARSVLDGEGDVAVASGVADLSPADGDRRRSGMQSLTLGEANALHAHNAVDRLVSDCYTTRQTDGLTVVLGELGASFPTTFSQPLADLRRRLPNAALGCVGLLPGPGVTPKVVEEQTAALSRLVSEGLFDAAIVADLISGPSARAIGREAATELFGGAFVALLRSTRDDPLNPTPVAALRALSSHGPLIGFAATSRCLTTQKASKLPWRFAAKNDDEFIFTQDAIETAKDAAAEVITSPLASALEHGVDPNAPFLCLFAMPRVKLPDKEPDLFASTVRRYLASSFPMAIPVFTRGHGVPLPPGTPGTFLLVACLYPVPALTKALSVPVPVTVTTKKSGPAPTATPTSNGRASVRA